MSRRLGIVLLSALLVGMLGVPAVASPPDKFEAPWTFLFPDFENELAVFVNIDRATYCTPEVVADEEAFAAWLAGGMVGPPPVPPIFPDGFELVKVMGQETGQGAIVGHVNEQDLFVEVWHLDAPENRLDVGPCTDTDDEGTYFADGRTSYKTNDNDVFGTDTRGNSFGNQGKAALTDGDGADWTYKWKFHLNSRCYAPMDGPPSCLINPGTLTAN